MHKTILIEETEKETQQLQEIPIISYLAKKATNINQIRFPIDLICVVDVSGSMNDYNKINLLKEALLNLLSLLNENDRMCIITFSTDAERLTKLLNVGKEQNRQYIQEQIEKLTGKGSTNINNGMHLAFEVLKQRKYKNAVSSIFLLSDGLDENADVRVLSLLKKFDFYQNYEQDNFTINTFGFGEDHCPILMDNIAQLMDGNFYFIEELISGVQKDFLIEGLGELKEGCLETKVKFQKIKGVEEKKNFFEKQEGLQIINDDDQDGRKIRKKIRLKSFMEQVCVMQKNLFRIKK
ncbi:von willebrand factor type a domain protein [Ichthyophthirius multifiliis]|uniref:von willebrand factor type a domain protein n=1 Tax=Ichthyophthirius multifiliis TaxID=5932 RepID=G0QXK6_ICHMU|nr:von willebrand factor type a domain protein [Ichthyophthirius multifiliis]EGR30036.1 von willebrand factor type a domain protein [Ichthyophthirius multifiliis]|eukprot:XP_004031272.1 von willebrand factor type a domain protein [Ichthyophthirius multifiliis]